MVDIVTIPHLQDVNDILLIRHVPNYSFLDFKETMYFYYGNKYNQYNWIDQYPIKIEPKDKDKLRLPLINILQLYIPIMQKYNMNIVVYIEPYLIKDGKIRNTLFPTSIIIFDTKHLREKNINF